jgi:MiaB-like tRNA modifying enzyme
VRVHVEVYGCATTEAEGSTMEALARRAGHELVDEAERADAAVLVTCTVVDKTQRRMVERIQALDEQVDTLVVSGCMASAQPEAVHEIAPHALVLPPSNLDQLVPLLEEGRFTPAPVDKAGLPRTLEDGLATIVINDGCLGNCTFCITKKARPGLRSYPIDSIVDAIQDAVDRGAVEVRLTSMDTGAYGQDRGTNLAELVREAREVAGDARVRIGMLNPFLGIPFLDDLLEAMDDPNVYNFLHVPVQSGSDAVLDHMEREHSVADFEHVCQRAREVLGEVTIATDVIVGYPTETEEDHDATVDLLERTRPGHVNVTRFSPRPGTPAAELDELDGGLVKDRSRELSDVRDRLQETHRGRLAGRTVEATVAEHVVEGTSQARTAAYDPVVLPEELPIGTRVRARVTGSTTAHAEAEIVDVLDDDGPVHPQRARAR